MGLFVKRYVLIRGDGFGKKLGENDPSFSDVAQSRILWGGIANEPRKTRQV